MPEIEGNFCASAYAWMPDIVRNGAALHFLCSDKWHGTCTKEQHTLACTTFFHLKRFSAPIECHPAALAVFFKERTTRTDADEQLAEYARRIFVCYTTADIMWLGKTSPRLREPLRRAYAVHTATRTSNLEFTPQSLLDAAEAGVVPRRLLPKKLTDVLGHADPVPTTLAAARYVNWINHKDILHQGDVPALDAAVHAALAQLPPELSELVRHHLYEQTCSQPQLSIWRRR